MIQAHRGGYRSGRRLRILDVSLPGLGWVLLLYRPWAYGKPKLELSLWKAGRRRWFHFWTWEDEPGEAEFQLAMPASTMSTLATPLDLANIPTWIGSTPPVEDAAGGVCHTCQFLRQAGVRGVCDECGDIL